jgi:hypothetical protein
MTKRVLLRILDLYRYWISPVLHSLSPTGCKFQPTCSHYASEAIILHGAVRGGWLALGRLFRCHPFTRGGFDPVPLAAHSHEHEITMQSPAVSARGGALHEPLP